MIITHPSPNPTIPSTVSSLLDEALQKRQRWVAIAARIVGESNAEDVYQDVVVKIIQSPELDSRVENKAAYLSRMVTNAALYSLRLRRRQYEVEACFGLSQPRTYAPCIFLGSASEEATTMLAARLSGYTLREIAEQTGLSPVTVRNRLLSYRNTLCAA